MTDKEIVLELTKLAMEVKIPKLGIEEAPKKVAEAFNTIAESIEDAMSKLNDADIHLARNKK